MTSSSGFVLDCDTGRDDALAIWIALALKMPLRAIISSYGNTIVENVHDNNRRVLALADALHLPVFKGRVAPTKSHLAFREIVMPRQKSAGNGLCNLILPPVPQNDDDQQQDDVPFEDWLRAYTEKNGAIDYVITGPASNLAALFEKHGDDLKSCLNSITMMGGKLDAFWQETPGPDFNLACDPFAVQTLLETDIPLRFVPIDATWPIAMDLAEIEALSPQGKIAEMARELIIAHCKNFAPEPVFRFHDPAVMIALTSPDLFHPAKASIICDESSPDFGRLVIGNKGANIEIFETDPQTRPAILATMLDALSLGEAGRKHVSVG